MFFLKKVKLDKIEFQKIFLGIVFFYLRFKQVYESEDLNRKIEGFIYILMIV